MGVVIGVLSWACLLAGAFVLLVSAVGVLRLPDVFTRFHAAGMTDTLGAALTLTGLILQAGLSSAAVKLLLIWVFLWATSPVATHSVTRAALLGGVAPRLSGRAEWQRQARGAGGEERAVASRRETASP